MALMWECIHLHFLMANIVSRILWVVLSLELVASVNVSLYLSVWAILLWDDKNLPIYHMFSNTELSEDYPKKLSIFVDPLERKVLPSGCLNVLSSIIVGSFQYPKLLHFRLPSSFIVLVSQAPRQSILNAEYSA